MPDSRVAPGNVRDRSHKKPNGGTPSNRSEKSGSRDPAPVRAPQLGSGPGPSAFLRHATALGDSRMAQPMYAQQRALLVRQLQREYGNRYVQRLVMEMSQTPEVTHASDHDHVHRHASWEHKMLGDVDPDTLEIIASGRDVAEEEKKRQSFWSKTRNSAKTIQNEKGKTIDIETVLHTIDQEISRLQYFRKAIPEGTTVADATKALQEADASDRKKGIDQNATEEQRTKAAKEIDDSKWDVRLVELALSDGKSFLVTYGELNTLADFYGSRAELAQTPADNFRGILAGVREESLRKFMRLRNELTISGPKQYDPDQKEKFFAGAIGNTGQKAPVGIGAVMTGDQYGEVKLMGKMGKEKRQEIDNKAETSYAAGLARNACHFAPQSWHSWASAHNKGTALALQAWAETTRAQQLQKQISDLQTKNNDKEGVDKAIQYNQTAMEAARKKSAEQLNEALIENGFGDHFLQDSYAAGHLINKTLIMQWFAKWLDTKGAKRDYSTEEEWRQVQQIAYGQPDLAGKDLYDTKEVGKKQSNDPQSVENLEGDWTDRFKALGLSIPGVLKNAKGDEFNLFTWWQEQAMGGKLLTSDAEELRKKSPVNNAKKLEAALVKLIDGGVVYYNWYSAEDRAKGAKAIGLSRLGFSKSLRLKKEYIPDKKKADTFKQAVSSAKEGDSSQYEKMAQAVTYADYHKFLNHGYLQLASNVLHDDFCKNGLYVATKEGETPYKIYGDNAMLGKESAKMVKESARTSHMSRDSIYELAATGKTKNSTKAIAARFPTWVRPAGISENLSLAAWHGESGALHDLCWKTIFPRTAGLFSKSTFIASDALTGKVSKDDTKEVHSGQAF